MTTSDVQATERKAKRKTRWIVVGAFVGGAFLTSAADLVTKPVLAWLGNVLFDLATLGLNSLRNDMYAQVAEMQTERASIVLFSIFMGIFAGVLIVIFVERRRGDSPRRPEGTAVRSAWDKKSVWRTRFRAINVAIFLGFFLITSFRVTYVALLSNRVDQLQRTIAPFVSDQERLMNTSRIASMRTRDEFVSIWSEMASVATANGKPVPEITLY